MLNNFRVHPTIPALDLQRARQWYADTLGLHPTSQDDAGLWYDCRDSLFLLYPSANAGQAPTTLMEWSVEGLESIADQLRDHGVEFEHYDLPGVEWEGDVAVKGTDRACWFRDSEGNILALTELRGR